MSWNIIYLRKKLQQYKNLRKLETDTNKQLKLDETIGSIQEILDYSKPSLFNSKPNFREIYGIDSDFQQLYYKLNPYIIEFVGRFENEEVTYEVDTDKISSINRNSILNMTNDFYRTIRDTRFTKPYRELRLKSNKLVKFKSKNKFSKNEFDEGITFQIYNTKEILMLIKTNKTIQDIITTIHEYAHGIAFLINQDHSTDLGKYPFVEVDSIFFEMLGTEHVGALLNVPKQALNIDIDRFYDYLLSALIINCKLNVHTMIIDGKLNKKDIIKYLKDVEHLADDEINSVLYKPMAQYYHYVISYLTAIELYMLYRDMPEASLDALHEIVAIKDINSSDYITLLYDHYGITLGQNTHAYFEMLKNRIEVLNNGKQIQYTN